MDNKLDINPQTKVGEMLDAYPQLEKVLTQLSSSFAKLKNPVLRKTVARVVSIKQAAEIGNVDIGEMIFTLRKAAGLSDTANNNNNTTDNQQLKSEWLDTKKVSVTFDASAIIERGESPMKSILEKAGQLSADEIMLLITPFKPVPIIQIINSKGHLSWSESVENKTYTYILNK